MNEETVAGLKSGPLLAGLLGAAFSMRAIADAGPISKLTSTITASGAAGYITPAIAEWLTLSQAGTNAVAFFVGLLILNFTAGLLLLSHKFSKDPIGATLDLFELVFKWRGISTRSKPNDNP